MQDIQTWNNVLYFAEKLSKLDRNVSHLMIKIAEIIHEAELMFGSDSDEMDNIFESVLDFRHSNLDDLLSFIEIISERQSNLSFKYLC